ncbi:family 43 glycosylhydrolase [Autumnicola musiva]|uniref:Family 43 glycosylhydrolase n=1 Tax=Autumnicola musiva TaxID=3075589 RepID=A0ABU3D4B5_9FLAO|nr:family 43 glycosylhydrolase [Zunongwangia sp. F117]MDT0676351.1 family 43 glycosylhydrolase [Zunongwangia sp. F117]
MKKKKTTTILKNVFFGMFLGTSAAFAQNPLITDQFTADPTARVFGDRIYVYPSHDIVPTEGEGRAGWFNMADYHVFSSENLTNWTDHGVILDQKNVPWADSTAYSMWAPDAIEKDGKYYFYFPTRRKGASDGESGFSIGVAIADKPQGPFIPQEEPIEGVVGIDPNVFIDNDGQAYLYWSRDKIYGAKLKNNMLELASEPKVFTLPQKGHIEGPFVFEREGIYYLTYPHVADKTERLEYATGNDPLGPFKHQGVIMDESPTGVWTNHHSIVEFKDQWYLFYHDADLSPDFDKNRSIKADSLSFNENGLLKKVEPSLRGIGLTQATDKIQFDRFSAKSDSAVETAFLNAEDTFKGWKVILDKSGSWVSYNKVNLQESPEKLTARIRYTGEKGSLEVTDNTGNVIADFELSETDSWEIIRTEANATTKGIKDLTLKNNASGRLEVDWIRFE